MRKNRRGVSAGTVFMLSFLLIVLLSAGYVFLRLNPGNHVDLSALARQVSDAAGRGGKDPETSVPEENPYAGTNNPAEGRRIAGAKDAPNATDSPARQKVTLTVAGITAVEKNIRQSAYASDTKIYDFSDVLSMLRGEIHSDLNALFIENIMMDDVKVNDIVVPASAAELGKTAGFNVAMAGFSKAWQREKSGVISTASALKQAGIYPLGIVAEKSDSRFLLREAHGLRIALMQYTSTIDSATRKKITKNDAAWMIPEANAEQIASDITAAKAAGADLTIVFLNWGKVNAKEPDKNQTALAQQIADAGADAVIGSGPRVPQAVTLLNAADGREVLCAWSLGTLISDERSRANRVGGFLLHLTYEMTDKGIKLTESTYTPTYTWRYRQDDKYYYKCMAAGGTIPDGMDNEQSKFMEKALTAVQSALEGSVVTPRQE